MKNKRILIIVLTIALISLMGGVTYAFFNYTRTGEENTFRVGRIAFRTNQTSAINLTNIFPIDPNEAGIMDDNTKVGTLEITIEGDTDHNEGIEYLVSTTNTNVYTNKGTLVPISIDLSVNGLGSNSDTYFTARNSKNSNIYKKLSGNMIVGNQNLMVGYIKPNTTTGTKEGVNGSITIKAYLDENNIAITDTPNENIEWQRGRTVISTSEWSALQSTGLSFQIKIEANEGIWVAEPMYNNIFASAVMDNIASTNVTGSEGIDFSKTAGDTDSDGVIDNGEGLYIRSGTENSAYPIMYYRGNTNNNVFFANKCWSIIRTTDTGGIKMIYNGENTGTETTPSCNNTTAESRQISLNIDNVDTTEFKYNNAADSLAYDGYMYGTVYNAVSGNYTDGAYFGNSFTYDSSSNLYTLTDAKVGIDENHHYTCNSTSASGTCSSIRYYIMYYSYAGVYNFYLYINLSGGKSIDDAINEMHENVASSNAKLMVDKWYEENIHNTSYESKIEDTVYCNDRSIDNLGGFKYNGGAFDFDSTTTYKALDRYDNMHKPSFACNTHDAFTVSNTKGNGKLDYPVGLISLDELSIIGGISGDVGSGQSGVNTWTMTPSSFAIGKVANVYFETNTKYTYGTEVNTTNGLRPVISLNSTSHIKSGTGSASTPYIIE